MKKRPLRWLFALACFAGLTAMMAGSAVAGIVGSVHDLGQAWGDPQDRICVFCHTPHHAQVPSEENNWGDDYKPLWNRPDSTITYTMYTSQTITHSDRDNIHRAPTGPSKLCLSCHDGSIAIDSFSGNYMGTHYLVGDDFGENQITGVDSLHNDHPISFVWDDTLTNNDGELVDPETTLSPAHTGKTLQQDLLWETGKGTGVYKLECSSCHDVHNGPAAVAAGDNLLYLPQERGQICLMCHKK